MSSRGEQFNDGKAIWRRKVYEGIEIGIPAMANDGGWQSTLSELAWTIPRHLRSKQKDGENDGFELYG
ncbi:hypothetical protein N8737_03325 [Verrucomicrobia bacterium]|nr:hypothetical protein [Verrucomicrobiota bacterium]